MKANEIVSVLNNFKESSYQRVLINGRWGIGKTKYVGDFKEGYSNSCYVSLFGKKSIDSIIQEVYLRIIENAPIKKNTSILREKMKNLNISLYGFSLSIPIIEDLHKALNKELKQKATFIIIFDDLERKHDDLGIKEILGLIDSLSKIENIKTVLIAATEQLTVTDKELFKDYQEKAIDRIYTIEAFADEAPVNILGEEAWKVIGKLSENFKFNNLRTFEKTSLFIKEVVAVLGEDIFTDKFTRADLFRMCFASVFYKVEHKNEMILLNSNDDKDSIINAYYTAEESGVIEYLCNYILKNSLDNVMCKSVFQHINNWYETSTYSREIILNLIASINSYEKQPSNFYSSEEEILDLIDYYREYIKGLNGVEQLEDIITILSTSFDWCEVLTVDFGIGNEEILNLVSKNISNRIDLSKSSYLNEIDSWHTHIHSEEVRNVVNLINEAIRVEYYNQLIKRINDCFYQHSFNEYSYLRQLIDSIISIKYEPIKESLVKSLVDHNYFFPIPSGKITEEQWNWCNQIHKLIVEIARYWEMEDFYKDFQGYIYNQEITKKDKLLQHRLKQFFG